MESDQKFMAMIRDNNYKCDIDFIQQFNKQAVNMKRLTF